MVAITSKAALLGLAGTAMAAVVEKLDAVPEGWKLASTPASSQHIVLTLAMAPKNMDQMIGRLYEISDPAHKDYGKHYQKEELNAMIAPGAQAHNAVYSWLKNSGATAIKSDGMYIDFSTTVGNANKMFATEFNYHERDGSKRLRTTQYSIPDDVASYVDIVSPTVFFGSGMKRDFIKPLTQPRGQSATTHEDVTAPCADFLSPACVKELYEVGTYKADPASGARIGFGSFLNQTAIYSDLTDYENFYGLQKQSFAVHLINGGTNNQSTTINNIAEANLDVQNIVGVSQPVPITEYITGGSPPYIPDLNEPTIDENEPYMAYYRYLLAQSNSDLPQVISNSYGDPEETVPVKFAQTVCNQIAQMGMRGISILEASGDTGVGAACRSNSNGKRRFEPSFPAACPYVTSVGGTQSVNPEIAWTNGTGGFSINFPRPSYQDSMVNTYFSKYVSKSTLQYYQPFFNQLGRGIPDVSAHSIAPPYVVVYEASLYNSGGTSAASPVVAAVISLINDARMRQGLSSLGFLNPMLYSSGYTAFTDITEGGSVGCNGYNAQTGQPIGPGAGIIPYASWNATPGWDPVTGLGTPNFKKLLAMLAPGS